MHLGALSYARIGHHAPRPALSAAGIVSVNAIGDSLAPGTIAAAVYAGHRYGREFDLPETDLVGFRREMPQ